MGFFTESKLLNQSKFTDRNLWMHAAWEQQRSSKSNKHSTKLFSWEKNKNGNHDYQYEESPSQLINIKEDQFKTAVENLDLNQISRILSNGDNLNWSKNSSNKSMKSQNPLEKVHKNINMEERQISSFCENNTNN